MAPSTITGAVSKDPGATITGPGSHGAVTTQSMSTIETPPVPHINGNINLNNANLTLSGDANSHFIVNVTGNQTLTGSAALALSGGVLAGNVIYNFYSPTSACVLQTKVGDVINGIILATGCGASSLDGTWNGEIIYGGTSVTLLSNAQLNEVPGSSTATPEPSTLLLLGSSLVCAGLVRRKLQSAGKAK